MKRKQTKSIPSSFSKRVQYDRDLREHCLSLAIYPDRKSSEIVSRATAFYNFILSKDQESI